MRHHNIFFADLKFYLWSIHMTNNLILAISVGFKLNSNLKSTVSSRSRWGSRPGFLSSLLCSKDAIVDENVTNFITEYNVRMLATFLWSSLETEGEKLSLRVYKRTWITKHESFQFSCGFQFFVFTHQFDEIEMKRMSHTRGSGWGEGGRVV